MAVQGAFAKASIQFGVPTTSLRQRYPLPFCPKKKKPLTTYFKELENVLHKHSLMDKPQHIYNVDEKGLQTEHSPPFVVGCRETTTPAITSARTATTTVIGCGNALGAQIPPYFVFKGERMREELLEGRTPGAEGTVTPTGWSNREVPIWTSNPSSLRLQ
ncbi:hypothetical protein DPMN_004541 [Dreissena polymorpha]|uniref:Uncharacterized protein n=1 Tax=Dreissena polymorpha TaxID=45954 RepID=A0A9D4RW03_DREPO|nr:hypothetical protein DPMN_004541 [Dreissena polymorpha]